MYSFLHYEVRDVMTSSPTTVTKEVTLAEAEAIFEKHDFNGLPVVEDGRLVGVVTKMDILKAFAFTEKLKVPPYDMLMKKPVEGVMTTRLDFVRPDTPLTRVLQRMIETKFKSLPVVEDDRVVGIIAREDILSALAKAGRGEKPPRLAGE